MLGSFSIANLLIMHRRERGVEKERERIREIKSKRENEE
jgi:hypothetical protein